MAPAPSPVGCGPSSPVAPGLSLVGCCPSSPMALELSAVGCGPSSLVAPEISSVGYGFVSFALVVPVGFVSFSSGPFSGSLQLASHFVPPSGQLKGEHSWLQLSVSHT